MNDALTIIEYIFVKQLNFVFNDLEILPNVTIGWVIVVITIFSILIYNVVNIARSSPIVKGNKEEFDRQAYMRQSVSFHRRNIRNGR